jgi:hypothetical protein
MSDFLPEGESLRRALKWISDRRREEPGARLVALVEEAGRRFDLGPLDQEFLFATLAKKAAS